MAKYTQTIQYSWWLCIHNQYSLVDGYVYTTKTV